MLCLFKYERVTTSRQKTELEMNLRLERDEKKKSNIIVPAWFGIFYVFVRKKGLAKINSTFCPCRVSRILRGINYMKFTLKNTWFIIY